VLFQFVSFGVVEIESVLSLIDALLCFALLCVMVCFCFWCGLVDLLG